VLLDGIRGATSGLKEITSFDTSPFRTRFGGQIADFDPSCRLTGEEIKTYTDPNIQLALTAARDALDDAGIGSVSPFGRRFGLVVGTCNGGLRIAEDQYRILLGQAPGAIDRKMVTLIRYHTLGKALALGLSSEGPTWITATACSSSTGALGLALDLIELGVVDRLLVGGSDVLCLSTMAGFDAIRATSTEKTAPFSLPVGLNLGEGAAFFVVESESAANERNAPVLGEILGYALTADAHHPTAPDPRGDGAFRTMTEALNRGGVPLDRLGCINAHGTGTDANDRVESKAVGRLVGDTEVPVYSFKSQVGHCLGAAGIIEAACGLLAMRHDLVPATANFGEARPGCQLDYVPNTPRNATYDAFLSCNYAFGGNNAGVVIGKAGRFEKRAATRETAVITGVGMLTSLGVGNEKNIRALEEKRRGIGFVGGRVNAPSVSRLAGLVKEFDPKEVDRRLDLKSMNPISRYATIAARLALLDADLRIGPKEGLDTGVVNGVYVGPSEEVYMNAVVGSHGREADIGGFSQIVANSVAGWVSCALQLKGYSTTVAQGADAGLFAAAAAAYAVRNGNARRVLAGAADELYPRYFLNYDEIGLLHTGDKEERFGIDLETADRRVLGEGAAYAVIEGLSSAKSRSARILATVLGHGMTTDCDGFFSSANSEEKTAEAVRIALDEAGWSPSDVGLIIWSPQGNSGDLKILNAAKAVFGEAVNRIPMVTSVFHTGLMESASGIATLAAVLTCWKLRAPLWPSICGYESIDRCPLPSSPVKILLIVSSEIGFNAATAIAPYQEER
jgi:3-oxoacyl-[acyl-carrier-protein] synthase II